MEFELGVWRCEKHQNYRCRSYALGHGGVCFEWTNRFRRGWYLVIFVRILEMSANMLQMMDCLWQCENLVIPLDVAESTPCWCNTSNQRVLVWISTGDLIVDVTQPAYLRLRTRLILVGQYKSTPYLCDINTSSTISSVLCKPSATAATPNCV